MGFFANITTCTETQEGSPSLFEEQEEVTGAQDAGRKRAKNGTVRGKWSWHANGPETR